MHISSLWFIRYTKSAPSVSLSLLDSGTMGKGGEKGKSEMKKEHTVGGWHRCFLCRTRRHFQTAAARGKHHFAYENLVKLTRSLIKAFIIF